MQSSEVLESLSNIKGRVEAHLRNVKEYRAFLAIQAAMDEISHIGELVTPLEGVKDGVRQRLNDLREYRALLAVEKSIADIANVLGLLDEITPRPTPQESAAEPAASHLVAADAEHHEQPAAARPEPAPQPAAFTAAIAVPEIIAAPSPTDVAPTLPSSREVNVIVTPAQAAAGTAPFAASEAAGVTLATVFATYAPPVSETVVTSVEQDVDTLRFALGATSAPATEPPVVPLTTSEPNPESDASAVVSGDQEAPGPGPEHDPSIAKVA